MLSRLGLSLLMFLAAILPASAHHGWGSYDSSKTVTVEGKILNASYENPHVTVTVEGQDKTTTLTIDFAKGDFIGTTAASSDAGEAEAGAPQARPKARGKHRPARKR